jgi:hypothetical protein
VSYNDVEIEYDRDGEIEAEYDEHDGSSSRILEQGQGLLQNLDRAHALDILGR